MKFKMYCGWFYGMIICLFLISCNKGTHQNSASQLKQTELIDTMNTIDYKTTADVLQDYKLVWQDEFEGDALDRSKWNYRQEGVQRNYAEVSRNTIHLDKEGHLIIEVTQDEEGDYYVGQVGTEGLFETRYGYFETRAKMNEGEGPHVAFWLQSPTMANTDDNPGENGVEIDVFEYHKKTPYKVHHNIHWNGYDEEHRQIGTEVPIADIGEGFHTFGMLWTPKRYVFYVDGKRTWETDKAISHRMEYLILSTELTGFGGNPENGNYPDAVTFDYVRVYKPKK